MKQIRDQARSGMAAKLSRYGGAKSLNRVKHGMPQCDGSKGYATGGSVSGGPVEGMSAKPRLDRPGRTKAKGKSGKGKTNVNVIVMPKEGNAAPPAPPMPPPPMAGPPGPPPMPPPGAGPGGPPMPMRASGGRVGYKIGGRVKRAEGGPTISEDSRRAAADTRKQASSQGKDAAMHGIMAAGNASLTGRFGPFGKLGRTVMGATGLTNAGIAADSMRERSKLNAEADRIERGEAEPGKEDRKHGGKVSKKC